MALFLGIALGEEKRVPGLRVTVPTCGERVYIQGKWLDLGDDHAVAWIANSYRFVRPCGKRLFLGDFPAWVVISADRKIVAAMFNVTQFCGGILEVA